MNYLLEMQKPPSTTPSTSPARDLSLAPHPQIRRRDVLRGGALLAAYSSLGAHALPLRSTTSVETVRDRLWLWGHYEGSHNEGWNLPAKSRITPVEAAYYMSLPNVVLVRYEGKPEMPFDLYAVPFRALHQVIWSVVGAGGKTTDSEREATLKMAEENENFRGVIMDDFFAEPKNGPPAALSIENLVQLQRQLKSGKKKLDLWVTLYMHQLDNPIAEYLKYCDVLTLWTWKANDLSNLTENIKKAENLSPGTRRVLGCYMWDYGNKQPMPLTAMQQQCEQGLEWLRQGRIEGMIFLASCICDLNLEAVEWTRKWIQKVEAQPLTRPKRVSGTTGL
jgi:hypothetical protein